MITHEFYIKLGYGGDLDNQRRVKGLTKGEMIAKSIEKLAKNRIVKMLPVAFWVSSFHKRECGR